MRETLFGNVIFHNFKAILVNFIQFTIHWEAVPARCANMRRSLPSVFFKCFSYYLFSIG